MRTLCPGRGGRPLLVKNPLPVGNLVPVEDALPGGEPCPDEGNLTQWGNPVPLGSLFP